MNKKLKWIGCASDFLTATFHPTDKLLLVASSAQSSISCFDSSKETLGKPEIFNTEHLSGLWDVVVSNNGNWVVTCGEDHCAYLFNFKNKKLTPQRLLDRGESGMFTASFSYSGDLVATAGADGVIKLHPVNTEVNKGKTRLLKGHEGYVLSIAFDPLREYLASCGSDGTFRIWRTDNDEELSSLEIITAIGDPRKSFNFCRASWSPDGKYIAVPTDSCISISERPPKGEDWTTNTELQDEDFVDSSCVCWSPNSKYLVSGHTDGSVFLWDIESGETIERVQCVAPVSSLSWHQESNEVLIACTNGHFAIWSNILDLKKLKVTEKSKAQEYSQKQKFLESLIDDEAEETDGEEGEESTVHSELGGDGSSFIDDTEVLKVSKKRKVKEKKSNEMIIESKKEEFKPPLLNLDSQYHSFTSEESQRGGSSRGIISTPSLFGTTSAVQRPFQVNSSHEADTKRYLAWNEIGKITNRYDSGVSTLKVEFANNEKYKNIAVSKSMYVTHAALSENAFIIASSSEESSTLVYQKFQGVWTQNTDWTIRMPDKEPIQLVAMCSNHIAVSTSKYLRIFDSSGLQTEIIGKQHGQIMTMVGWNDLLCVVKAETSQKYHFDIYKMGVDSCAVIKTASYLLSEVEVDGTSVELAWVGFNDNGQVAVMDNLGTISVLVEKKNEVYSQWSPVLESSTVYDGAFWIVKLGIDQIIYVPIKVSTGAPAFIPSPIPNSMNLGMPLIVTGNTKEEELFLRNRLFLKEDAVLREVYDFDRRVIGLYNVACKQDKCERALCLASYLKLVKSFDFALKVAQQQGLSLLATRVNAIKLQREEEEELRNQASEIRDNRGEEENQSSKPERKKENSFNTSSPQIEEEEKQIIIDTPSSTSLNSSGSSSVKTSNTIAAKPANLFPKAQKTTSKRKIESLWG